MAALSEYANPWDKVTRLLRRGDIIRVKKGLYIFGDRLRRRPFSRELIPERVEAVTSVTTKRPKKFSTPIGAFLYRNSPMDAFYLGMDRVEDGDVAFLIATPERALADKIRDDRGHSIRTAGDAACYLFEDLRIDESEFERMSADSLEELAEALHSNKVAVCARLLRSSRSTA